MRQKLVLATIFTFSIIFTGWAQISIGTTTPDPSAQLEVHSDNKGFLPPRIALTATNIAAPVSNPVTGLLVFNTATTGTSPTNVIPGYYYWNGTAWYPVVNKGNAPGDMQYWNGTRWVMIPAGANGSVLTLCGGVPTWGMCSPIIIQLANDSNDIHVDSQNLGHGTGDAEIPIGSWTTGGIPENYRAYLKFDLHQVPLSATIINATLYLNAIPIPQGGDKISAHYGPANSFYVERVTGNWNQSSLNWNNQPSSTTVNRVIVPQSASAFENTAIDVTGIVKDMQNISNYGFIFRLQNETYYNIRQYASSYYSNAALHPKLVITFQ